MFTFEFELSIRTWVSNYEFDCRILGDVDVYSKPLFSLTQQRMTNQKFRPIYGGVNIRRKRSVTPDFEEELFPTPYHDHSLSFQDNDDDDDDGVSIEHASHGDANAVDESESEDEEEGSEDNGIDQVATDLFMAFFEEDPLWQPEPGPVPLRRLSAAKLVQDVKIYSTSIHFLKDNLTRDNLEKINNVDRLQAMQKKLEHLMKKDGLGYMEISHHLRVEMSCEFSSDFDFSSPSAEYFAHILPVLQLVKNNVRLQDISNEDVKSNFETMNYWMATPVPEGAKSYFPKALHYQNPFFGWGEKENREHDGVNKITPVGKNIFALYLNQLGVWTERIGRILEKEFSGVLVSLPTFVLNDEGEPVPGKFRCIHAFDSFEQLCLKCSNSKFELCFRTSSNLEFERWIRLRFTLFLNIRLFFLKSGGLEFPHFYEKTGQTVFFEMPMSRNRPKRV